jgi:hypothetical protein
VTSWPASSNAGAKFQAKLPAPRIAIFNFIKKLSQFLGKEKAIFLRENGFLKVLQTLRYARRDWQ